MVLILFTYSSLNVARNDVLFLFQGHVGQAENAREEAYECFYGLGSGSTSQTRGTISSTAQRRTQQNSGKAVEVSDTYSKRSFVT